MYIAFSASAEGTSQYRWKCVCSGDGLPEVATGHESNCFVSCNCNSGNRYSTFIFTVEICLFLFDDLMLMFHNF